MFQNTSKRLFAKPTQIVCLTCDGAGMLAESGARYGVKLCHGCNGAGIVLVDHGKSVIRFDVDKRIVQRVSM